MSLRVSNIDYQYTCQMNFCISICECSACPALMSQNSPGQRAAAHRVLEQRRWRSSTPVNYKRTSYSVCDIVNLTQENYMGLVHLFETSKYLLKQWTLPFACQLRSTRTCQGGGTRSPGPWWTAFTASRPGTVLNDITQVHGAVFAMNVIYATISLLHTPWCFRNWRHLVNNSEEYQASMQSLRIDCILQLFRAP